jgi:uncharacterized protein (UPF0147 family)
MTKTKKAVDLTEVFQAIEALESDEGVPRSVKAKIENIKTLLNSDVDIEVKLSKSFSDLDELSEDINIPSYIRTHIYNISSILEKLNSRN